MLIDWPEVNQDNKADRVWADVTRHAVGWQGYFFKGDYQTTSHETTHKVNSDIMNSRGGATYGFYLLASKAVVSQEPKFDCNVMQNLVPENLHGPRFSTYISNTSEGTLGPLYVWDEWTAYQNGSLCAAELKRRSEYTGEWSDWAMGSLEFNIYGLALLAACRKYDTGTYKALVGDFTILWQRGWRAFYGAMNYFPWDTQTTYFQNILSMSGNELTDVLRENNLTVPILRK